MTALAIGLQLADTGLDLSEFITSDNVYADAAGIVGLSEFLFGCLALALYRYH